MVTGVAPATMAAAAQLGLRRTDDPEGEGEGGRAQEDVWLTRSPKDRPERGGEHGYRGNGARRPAAGVEKESSIRAIGGLPARFRRLGGRGGRGGPDGGVQVLRGGLGHRLLEGDGGGGHGVQGVGLGLGFRARGERERARRGHSTYRSRERGGDRQRRRG